MLYFVNKDELCAELAARKSQGQSIGLVPTMGALHDGHLSLVSQAEACDTVVVTIYVNPLQFNNQEDLEKYPTDLELDMKKLEEKCDILFAPSVKELYHEDPVLKFNFGYLETTLEGECRPGHFNGVGLIVSKFLNIVQPDVAFFGLKDLQQFTIVKRLVQDLSIATEIVGCETIRRETGLAMSSRNVRLSKEGRTVAANIYGGLKQALDSFNVGKSANEIHQEIMQLYGGVDGLKIEYCEVIDENFRIVTSANQLIPNAICVAGYVEGVRLIDNIYLRTQN